MTYHSATSNRHNYRTFIASLLAYVLLTSQLAPVAFALNRSALRTGSKRQSEVVREAASETQPPGVSVTANAPGPVPVALTMGVPNIVATKIDSYPSAPGGAMPGEVITYNILITNNGTDANNVTLTDTVDPNTTIVGGSAKASPILFKDAYSVLGNVRIQVPDGVTDLLGNDVDPDTGTNAGLTITTLAGDASAPFAGTSISGGQVTAATGDGSFAYNPPPGFVGIDTFTYTATDSDGNNRTATVTLTITGMLWFVNSAAPGGGDGRLTTPFNCLVGTGCFDPAAADVAGDNIFLYSGAYTGGLTLLNAQKLIGQGATTTLDAIAVVTVPAFSDALPALNGNSSTVTITTSAATTNGVNLAVGANNTIRGFTIGNTTGADIASGANFLTLTALEVTLNGTGRPLSLTTGALAATFQNIASTSSSGGPAISLAAIGGTLNVVGTTAIAGAATQGISISGSSVAASFGTATTISGSTTQGIFVGTTTGNISFGNTTVTGGTDGVSFQNNSSGTRTFGTLSVSGGSGNAFLHGAVGGNVTINGAANLSSALDAIEIQNAANLTLINFAAGATVTKSTAGGEGVHWSGTNTGATLTFNSLSVTTSNATGNTAGITASGGGTINVTNGTGSLTVVLGPAISASGLALNANFANVSSAGSTVFGIGLTTVTGTSNFGGGSIATAAGAAFFVSAGSPTVTYNGSVTQNTGQRVVDIQSTTAGTITLGGTVTAGASSTGVILNADNGNVGFSTLNLGTSAARMTNQAVTITGGTGIYSLGSVAIFTNGATGIGATNADGTLNSTTGTVDSSGASAINIDGPVGLTTLGMTLTSVTSNGGTADGISIQDTNGTFTVAGNGGTCTTSATCTGGTIANKTGADGNTVGTGIFVNNASGVSVTRMKLNDFTNYAVRGTNATSFTMNNCFIDGANGDNGGADEGTIIFDGLFGTSSFSGDTIKGGIEDNFRIINASGTCNVTIDSCTIRDTSTTSSGNDNVNLRSTVTASITAHVTNNTFAATNGDHLQTSASDQSSMTIVATGNALSGGGGGSALGQGITISGGSATPVDSTETVRFNISNNGTAGNPMTGTIQGGAININQGSGNGNWQGQVVNNFIGNAAVNCSGASQSSGVRLENHAKGVMIGIVSNNTIRQTCGAGGGISLSAGDTSASGLTNGPLNATVFNNSVIIPAGGPPFNGDHGIVMVAGNLAGNTNQVCVNFQNNNTTGNTAVGTSGQGFRIRQRFSATIFLPGYGGASTDIAAVRTYILGRPNTAAGDPSTANNGDVSITVQNPPGGGFVNGGAQCTQPTVPTAPVRIKKTAPGGIPDQISATPTTEGQPSAQNSPSDSITSRPFISSPRPQQLATAQAPAAGRALVQSADNKNPAAPRPPVAVPADPPMVNGDTLTFNVGTLPAGQSVTITFQVTVDSPYTGGPNVSNQGTVTADGGISVLTDDTAVGGANDPTLTPIAQPSLIVRDASVAEPASGSTSMLFTLSLSTPAPAGGITVNLSTTNGTATGGTCGVDDYTTVTGGTVTFASGEQIKTFPVTVCSDANVEGDETFTLNVNSAPGTVISDGQGLGTITANVPGTILISELRTSGPAGAGDDFVEIYNNTATAFTVPAGGYGLFKRGVDCNALPVLIGTIPVVTIPARGHYLFAGPNYSLGAYAAGNALTPDIESDFNVGLFSTVDPLAISTANRLDAVGFVGSAGGICDLLGEGTALPQASGSTTEYSFVRKFTLVGNDVPTPTDGNDNAADFTVVSTTELTPVGSNAAPTLGVPAPENLADPNLKTYTQVGALLIDPMVSQALPPNRVRDNTPDAPNNSTFGTIAIRRKFVNNTGAPITRLRFRIYDITTSPPPVGTADLRARTAADVMVTVTGVPGLVTVLGTTLEVPPTQPKSGGLNSSLAANTVTLGSPLAAGASINLNFLLGVQQSGTFRVFVFVEAVP